MHFYRQCWGVFAIFIYFIYLFLNLTYSRWTSSLPSCLWSLKIFPSLSGSRLTIFYRDANSALLQLVIQWLNFTYSRSHAFRYERNKNPILVRTELTTSALAGVQVTYKTTRVTLSIINNFKSTAHSLSLLCGSPHQSYSMFHINNCFQFTRKAKIDSTCPSLTPWGSIFSSTHF